MDFGELGLLPYPRKYDTSCDTWNWRISNLSREKHGGSRLGLVNIADAFQFNFKIYNLGIDDIMDKVEKTWNSYVFVNGQKNLGVIFNGLKGTG